MIALLYIVAPMIAACIISFILGVCWEAGRHDEDTDYIIADIESERVVHFGDQWPKVDR